MKVDRLSISSVKQYTRCGHQWLLRQELGPMPPGIALIKGRGLDKGANANMVQKHQTRADLPGEEIAAIAADEVEASFHGALALTTEERAEGLAKIKGRTKDQAVRLATTYASEVAPAVQPGSLPDGAPAVQAKITAKLPAADLDLVGILDLQDDAGVIRDLKSSGKSPVREAADKSAQLTMYALLKRALTGEPTSRLALDTVVLTDGGRCYAAPTQETERGPEEQLAMVERLHTIKSAIEGGIFIPTDPENWACSERFCGYYNVCRYVQKGVKRPAS